MTLNEVIYIGKYILQILPRVEKELSNYKEQLRNAPCNFLQEQALASINCKGFHAQGSGFFHLYGSSKPDLLPSLVALQTISDYLDNLCDRTDYLSAKGFRTLHLALEKATGNASTPQNYYLYYPWQEDGGYLEQLEQTCSSQLNNLPSYQLARKEVAFYIKLYSYLQTTKHLSFEEREPLLKRWFFLYKKRYPSLFWWEFAAATGSTLGIFILMTAARDPKLTRHQVDQLCRSYFPWICGLHILLDYFIDEEEDRQEKELNFASYYPNQQVLTARLLYFLSKSLAAAQNLPNPSFHFSVIKGMLALYLSDPKVKKQKIEHISYLLLKKTGFDTILYHKACCLLRRIRAI